MVLRLASVIRQFKQKQYSGEVFELPRSYEDRLYLRDVKTGEILDTTVMYIGQERIVGTGNVKERLRIVLLPKARELGGKNLRTRDFIDAFLIRGPDFGDVVRQTIDLFVASNKMKKRDVGTPRKPSYRYDLV